MGFISNIIEAIKSAIRWIKNLVKRVINGIFDFLAYCVNWFKSLRLNKEKHIPFVADAKAFKEMLKTAPTKNVGIFEGVFDETTDEIIHHQFIEADDVDEKTKETLGDEDLVILT